MVFFVMGLVPTKLRKGGMQDMKSKSVSILVVAALVFSIGCFAGGCGSDDDSAGKLTITDLAGRTVDLNAPAKSVVAIGPGALRVLCYTGNASKVVGVENMDKESQIGRPYLLANPELLALPTIGQGGPDSIPDPEMLMEVDPDVIFAAYLVDGNKANELQAQTGIPVVVLSFGDLGTIDERLYESIELVGRITGEKERAEEVAGYLKEYEDDLDARTREIPDDKKPLVYAGGLGMKGSHGIESTSALFPPFEMINANNPVDETGKSGSVIIDREKLLEWDPEYIFIDEVALGMMKQDYNEKRGFYEMLSAIKDGKLYGYLPFNYYTTNVGTAIADAYFFGKTIFPEAFSDVDPEKKADEIYERLLGKPVYDRMKSEYGGFMKIDLGG